MSSPILSAEPLSWWATATLDGESWGGVTWLTAVSLKQRVDSTVNCSWKQMSRATAAGCWKWHFDAHFELSLKQTAD